MCFSANASFGAGIVLSVIGVVSLKKVQHHTQIPFAAVPLIFAIQQITEGFLWLALTDPEHAHLQNFCTYLFLFFAQIVWPFWVPFAVILLHKKEDRKKIEKLFVVAGAIVSLYLGYCLINFYVEGQILGHHIDYIQKYPRSLSLASGLTYILVTIFPPFFSSIKRMWSLGAAILISYLVTQIFYENYVVSVWCFFASIISITVAVVMDKIKTSNYNNKIAAPSTTA